MDLSRISLQELRALQEADLAGEIRDREAEQRRRHREQEERDRAQNQEEFIRSLSDHDLEVLSDPSNFGAGKPAEGLVDWSLGFSKGEIRDRAASELRRREQRRREAQRQPEEKPGVIVSVPDLLDSIKG